MADYPAPVPARTPTQEEVVDEREQAALINEHFVAAISRGREAMWDVAHWAYEADQESVWLKLDCETKGEWLSWPEVHMTRRTFDRMVRVWRETVVQRKLDQPTLAQLDVSKVDIVLPKVNTHEVTIEDALSDVEVLGALDLREKYQPRPKLPDDEPEVFDADELASHEPPPEDDPEYQDQPEDAEAYDASSNGNGPDVEGVLLPRWLVQEIVDLYGPTRRMKTEWLDLLRLSLVEQEVGDGDR